MRFVLVLALLLAPATAHAGPVTLDPWTTVPPPAPAPTEESHLWKPISAGALGAFYVGFSSWAYFAWYFHHAHHEFVAGGDGWFGKTTYAGGADKLGHAWSGLTATRLGYHALRAGGWREAPALAISAGLSATVLTLVEVKDGFFYQFSYSDLTGDLLGTALGAALEIWPKLDRLVDYRVEYWPSAAYLKILDGAKGADVNALNVAEDYSGETYLLAFHLDPIVHQRAARYVDLAIGFRSRNYKPDIAGEMNDDPRQDLYLGVSLNAQGVLDDLAHGSLRQAFHGFFEVANLPFTSAPLVGVGRVSLDGHATE